MAGVELATAYYSLIPSMDGTAASVRSQSSSLIPVWDGIGNDAGAGLKGGILGAVGKLAVPLAAGFAAVGIGNLIGDSIRSGLDFAADGIDLASSVAETQSAIGQVFGQDSLGAINVWAGQGAEALGTTQLAALQAAQTFGVYGKAAGLAGTDLVGFSTDLAGLGTDLASFFNTSPQEAIEAIGAGLRGESEPLRRFGVLLDDATLRARAMEMGIYDGNGSLTQQQRVLAAQAEIFAQSSDAQGDFARTSDSLSNQQKILAASFDDAKTKLGTALLPAMTTFMQIANDQLIPVLNEVVEKVGPVLAEALVTAGPAFADMVTAIAPLIPQLVQIGTEILPPLIDLFIAISPLLIDWATNTATVFAALNDLFSFINGDISLQTLVGRLGDFQGSMADTLNGIGTFIGEGIAHFVDFATGVGEKIGEAITFVAGLPGKALEALGDLGSLLYGSGTALIQGFIDGIDGMFGAVGDAVGGIMDFVGGFFPNSPAEHGEFSGSGWTRVGKSGKAVYDEFVSGFNTASSSLSFGLQSAPAPLAAGAAQSAPYAAILYTLRQIEAKVGLTVEAGALQAATGSANIGVSTLGKA